MNKIIIKQISSKEDYQKCLEIRKKVFIEEQKVSKELEIEYEEESINFLAFFKNIAVATGRFRVFGCFIKFERVATLLKFRGLTIGSRLMKEMQKRALEQYPEYLQIMNSQKSAIGFYKKLGWIEIGEPFIEAGIEHIIMIYPPKGFKNLKCLKDTNCPKDILEYFV